MMTELAEIKRRITETEGRIKKGEDDGKSEAYIISLQTTLAELQKKENILLSSQGEFQLLYLQFALSNPIPSTFMIHMMTDNTCFIFFPPPPTS